MEDYQAKIDEIKSKLIDIEARLAINRATLNRIKTDIAFWEMITEGYESDNEEETND